MAPLYPQSSALLCNESYEISACKTDGIFEHLSVPLRNDSARLGQARVPCTLREYYDNHLGDSKDNVTNSREHLLVRDNRATNMGVAQDRGRTAGGSGRQSWVGSMLSQVGQN